MEGLVNYSSEDEQDDRSYTKVAVRERGSGASSGRNGNEASGHLKRSYEPPKNSCDDESYRKDRCSGTERYKSGNANEDKNKTDRRSENSRDHREKRDGRESRSNRDARDDSRDYDHSQKYDYKKHDDHKRSREQKKDHTRDSNDYYRDDKRYNRYDERKTPYSTNNKDCFSTSKSRNDDRKPYDDRFNNERRATNQERRGGGSGSGGTYTDDRRREFNDKRNYNNDDDRKYDRRSDDRRSQRSYNEDRSNSYRSRRSNSPLPSHHSKSSNKYSARKEDSNTRREHTRHSRSRSRSRSHSADKSVETNLASTKSWNQRTVPVEHHGEIKQRPETESQISDKKNLPTARNFEALLTLPLSENAPKHPNVVTVPVTSAAGSNTSTATIQLPSYYNPNVINPNKYVEQVQKRKLIWGAKKVEDSASKWGHAQFSQDQDGKVASKFMRLMGIKHATASGGGDTNTLPNESEMKLQSSNTPPTNKDVKSREAMFSTMEHQYEVARQVTHTMRGVGLGFSSQSRPY